MLAVKGGRPFALAQVAVTGQYVIAQLKPEGVGAIRSSSTIARSSCVPGSLQVSVLSSFQLPTIRGGFG
jgi:hypothetical protein